MDLEALIYQQNPQWMGVPYQKPEKSWPVRTYYAQVKSWLDKRLIIALTGIRRSGKSTLLKQIQYYLEEQIDNQHIFYFSFEKSQVRHHPDFLRELLEWYFSSYLKTSISQISKKHYIFLDEIQYIPFWQEIIKTYYDGSPNIKFLVSGSSSLFIKKQSLESLAGRMVELIIPPLAFKEYLTIKNIVFSKPLQSVFTSQKNKVIGYFEDYLRIGQFPEVVKDNYTKDQAETYLSTVIEKVIEQDIPKTYQVERIDVLRLIFEFLRKKAGSIVEYSNLANDLGVDMKTTRNYFEYLEKSYLLNFCLNHTKKIVKGSRTAKKIYVTSTNFIQENMGILAENYVYNHLSKLGNVTFYRKDQFEVDFVFQKGDTVLPIEVKYQEKIQSSDYRSLIKLSQLLHTKKAFLLTKQYLDTKTINEVTIESLPLCLLEGKKL